MREIVCCPKCRCDLRFRGAWHQDAIPVTGVLECPACGDIGEVQSLKYIFNAETAKVRKDIPAGIFRGQLGIEDAALELAFSPEMKWETSGPHYWSKSAGAKMAIRTSRSLAIAVVFLKHSWSGIANIFLDGDQIGALDLFEEKGSMIVWHPVFLGGGEHLIEIEVADYKNPSAQDSQVRIVDLETLNSNDNSSGIHYSFRNNGNPYPDCFAKLISRVPADGLILDCGCGDRNYPDARVINFEYSMFRSPDVFGDGHELPFMDNSFDLVLSQAVIEHLHDPYQAVNEIYRVLRPGGVVYAESAFMQPLHAVPYHFFNTTSWGLERLFSQFEIEKIGHEGKLSETLAWFYSLTSLQSQGHGARVKELLGIAEELDTHISSEELKSFSSYVTLLASKPAAQRPDS